MNSGNRNRKNAASSREWLVPIIVAIIGMISAVIVALINRTSTPTPPSVSSTSSVQATPTIGLQQSQSVPPTAPATLAATLPTAIVATIAPTNIPVPTKDIEFYNLAKSGLKELNSRDAQRSLIEGRKLRIVGRGDQPIWINQQMPNAFECTIRFQIQNNFSEFRVGFSSAYEPAPSLAFIISETGAQFSQFDASSNNNPITFSDSFKVRSGVPYTLTVKRDASTFSVSNPQELIAQLTGDETKPYEGYNYLYIATSGWDNKVVPGDVIVEEFACISK